MTNANGVILYEGPSQIDGAPIVVIATGLRTGSTNVKTGAMVQTYILRSDMPPIEAVKTGADVSICGSCRHRGNGSGGERSCYVTLIHGPRGVYAAYKRGSYQRADDLGTDPRELFRDQMVRLGSYGDPVAAPVEMWRAVLKHAAGWTGYTHHWKDASVSFVDWAPLVMASCDSEAEMRLAQRKMGYRTFRVTPEPFENIKGVEVVCPASHEAGQKVECIDCRACMGTSSKARVSIQIAAHGSGRKYVKEATDGRSSTRQPATV